MKVCKNLSEVATESKVAEWVVQKAFEKYFLRNDNMMIGEITVFFEDGGDRLNYVLVNENGDADCKEYFMEYKLNDYEWRVYTDGIVGWESCKVINIINSKMDITRATVITETGTQLNRRVKYINFEDELVKDGCIYFFDKE